ncbi:arginine--tRNA ligase [Beijerinckia indica]|uniref:Arginine--tRNA ligase n=1 Tax=Beijerinckia indica subsp. indica (strain ATCC 9039 / DSM 1715 / NCIMB 8712) TaxID=395963 RepID=SYR_BEII9|nr:arginine--tRNA ligase [Beijerinckia indica]B2IJG9.1 RecName: Full=Arginine--tRNA ligase; AltName: Full=Arginyl-tRNA synthetase; Short=ArgRS [Beijerinckia indica subsp. indica ATCC 9039]ACB96282.1 arginyl-tRNA synthetase [Beijerinckia indica subsp. indica ATCC 9039]
MNIFTEFHARIAAILRGIIGSGRLPEDLDLTRFVVEPPREAAHGDLAANAAMVYAKEAKPAFANPRQLAVEIAVALAEDGDVAEAEVAGPGFINIRLKPEFFGRLLGAALEQGSDFGRPATAAQEKINVEYVSANPTGPMHVGHGRGAVFGDALANLLAFAGFGVTREYYINDAGAQVDVLARSAHLRYREALGETIGAIPEGLYPGDYLKSVGASLAQAHGDTYRGSNGEEWLEIFRLAAIDGMMAMIRDDLAALNITHEVFFSERSLTRSEDGDQVAAAIAFLRDRGLVYEGRLPPPKGQAIEDWEDREQVLFKSTDFGDDVDRPLKKSDGTYTYFASDIAYHKTKIDRGYSVLIDVWGADHGGYVKRMAAAVKALSEGRVTLDVKLCQLVKLMRGGEPVKMSKRAGDFVTLREVVDEVGVDAVRFMMLFRKNDAVLEFDLAKVIEQSKDNPVFYVQYAHARVKSVFRQAATLLPDLDCSLAALKTADFSLLGDEGEARLIKIIAQFPRVVEGAALAHEPHRIAFYLHDLASELHAHWTRGKDQPHLRFIYEERRDLTLARLALVHIMAEVLASGLSLLGVSAPSEMR